MKEGWHKTTIGDLCTVIAGQSPKGSSYNTEGHGLPFYQGKKEFTDRKIGPPTKWTTSITKEADAGDILMSVRAPVGPINEATQRICIGRGLAALKSSRKVDRDFLWYALLRLQPKIVGNAGAVFPSISKAEIEKLNLLIPSIDEQKRIVAILDEAFEGLDRARANADANLQNARELFENYLAEQFLHGGVGNQTCMVGDLITLQRGFDITKKDQREGSVPVVSSGGVKSRHNEARAAAPGVVVGRKGSIGNVHFVEQDYWPHDTTLWVKNFKGNDPRLVYYLLRGMKLSELDSGAANPSLNRNLVHPLSVSWPIGTDQAIVSKRIADVEKRSIDLERAYLTKLEYLDDLRQSLLQKAFAGELT